MAEKKNVLNFRTTKNAFGIIPKAFIYLNN